MRIACIGSRQLTTVLSRMFLETCGAYLAEHGHCMTTGAAPGADQAYMMGFCDAMGPDLKSRLELYLPWAGFETRAIPEGAHVFTAAEASQEHISLAMQAHPAWAILTPAVRKLMIRNAMLIRRFDTPVDAVWAWPDMSKIGYGGTGHGMRVAEILGISVLNPHSQYPAL